MNKFTDGPWSVVNGGRMVATAAEGANGWELFDVRDDVYGYQHNAQLISAAPDLLEALENVQREHSLLLSMKNCELRRGKGSFGIAVMSDDIAKEWQSHNEELDSLIVFRLSAIAKARGEG